MESEDAAFALEVKLLLEAIHATYGYDFRNYGTASIQRRMRDVLAKSGLAHLGELQHRVLRDHELFSSVLDGLTVRVSEMFRDPSFYRSFRERVVPVLRTYPSIRIWHSGCASGEEVYASAILLLEEGLYERAQIYATDLSTRALDQAKEGVYSTEDARLFATNYVAAGGASSLDDYFTAAYGRIVMRESLRKNVHFFHHDLATDHAFGEMQVVFCRNVFIYFDEKLRTRVAGTLAACLCPGGFLCLGKSEGLPRDAAKAFAPFASGEHIYRRRGDH